MPFSPNGSLGNLWSLGFHYRRIQNIGPMFSLPWQVKLTESRRVSPSPTTAVAQLQSRKHWPNHLNSPVSGGQQPMPAPMVKMATKKTVSLAKPHLIRCHKPHKDPHYLKHKSMKFQMTYKSWVQVCGSRKHSTAANWRVSKAGFFVSSYILVTRLA